jgi:hypothetical protein
MHRSYVQKQANALTQITIMSVLVGCSGNEQNFRRHVCCYVSDIHRLTMGVRAAILTHLESAVQVGNVFAKGHVGRLGKHSFDVLYVDAKAFRHQLDLAQASASGISGRRSR